MIKRRLGDERAGLGRVGAWWRRHTEPSALITDEDDRRRAEMLANVAASLAVLTEPGPALAAQ